MNLLFVYPSALSYGEHNIRSSLSGKLFLRYMAYPFLDFQYLYLVTPERHNFDYVSETFNEIDFSGDYDIVGITAGTQQINRAYEIADEFRKHGKTVVLGGWHVSALPEEAKEHADSVVIGEGEESWPKLLKDFENKRLKPFYQQDRPVNLSKLPKRNSKKIKTYGINAFVQSSRGCSFRCKYCSITNTEHWRVYRTRPVEQVIEELSSMPQKLISFSESSLTINKKHTKELFREMKNLNKKFSCNGNIKILSEDDELLKLAADAGCIHWLCGFESINHKNIDEFCNTTKKCKDYKRAIKKIKDYGMDIFGNFIFGFDNDRINVFEDTLNVLYDWDLNIGNFYILTPFPGTPLYDKLDSEGRIFNKDWSLYNFLNAVFKPKYMTPEELEGGLEYMYKNFYSSKNALKRGIKSFKIGLYPFVYTFTTNLYFSLNVRNKYRKK